MNITANMKAFVKRRNMELELEFDTDVKRQVLTIWKEYDDGGVEPIVRYIVGNNSELALYAFVNQLGEDWPVSVKGWDQLKRVIKYAHTL